MMNDQLIKKAQLLFESRHMNAKLIDSISNELNVILNNDFSYLAEVANYEYSLRFDWAGFPDGIIDNTKYYRTIGLDNKYLILADQGDAGVVLMETQGDPEKPSPVIWCDYPDIFNLCEEGKFKYNPDIWPSFTDFFEYLVAEEEKRLNE